MSVVAAPARGSLSFPAVYDWRLNPHLTVRELLLRLAEEIDRDGEERELNCYLFACAIACTIDDAFAPAPPCLDRHASRIPILGNLLAAVERRWLRGRAGIRRMRSGPVGAWRAGWTRCVNHCCAALLGREFDAPLLRSQLACAAEALDARVLSLRMRVPEGFRCQDLAHHDVLRMVDLFLGGRSAGTIDKQRSILVIGPRTAGAYFAPLAAAYLRTLDCAQVSWITVRPKNGLSSSEARLLQKSAAQRAKMLVIDDHPNTGATLRSLLECLRSNGVRSEDISVAVPEHPSNPGFSLPDETARGVRLRMLPIAEQYKSKLMSSGWAAEALSRHFAAMGVAVQVTESPEQNAAFEADLARGFQVRMKRVFDVISADERAPRRVLAKSVGWGWLGYHAALAATRLEGFVPRPLFLLCGFLFSEWVEGVPLAAGRENETHLAHVFGEYVAARVRALPLAGDPVFDSPECGWCGWNDLLVLLRRLPGPYLGRMMSKALAREMRTLLAPQPVLVDGQMRPADWIRQGSRIYKTDFEQHNFAGGELSVVDPAWDLAAASFEFQFSAAAEDRMIRVYREQSGDSDPAQRLLLYKLLYAATAIRAARYWLARRPDDPRRQDWTERYLRVRDFATFALTRYQGRELPVADWKPDLFFVDIDGVLDRELLGFPHSTAAGVQAIELLRRAGFSVVLNTARSLMHVKEYCRAYGLPGGAAELGSVFWDQVRGEEVSLIEQAALTALDFIRNAAARLPGVTVDPDTRFAVRAFRFVNGRLKGLSAEDVEQLLRSCDRQQVRAILTEGETLFLSRGAGKGAAVAFVKEYLGSSRDVRCCAIGDSPQDLDMLEAVDSAFAPSNCSVTLKGACRRMKHPFQRGLLDAAITESRRRGIHPHWEVKDTPLPLLDRLLRAPDQSGWKKWRALLSRQL